MKRISEQEKTPFTITEWKYVESEVMKKINEIIEKNIKSITLTTNENIKAIYSFFPDVEKIKEFYQKIKNEWIEESNIEEYTNKIFKIKKFWFQTLRNQAKLWEFNEKNVLNFIQSIEENDIENAFKNFKIITQWKYNEEVYKRFSKEKKIDNMLNQLIHINKHSYEEEKIDEKLYQ